MRLKRTLAAASAALTAAFACQAAAENAPRSASKAKKTDRAAVQSAIHADKQPTVAGFWAQVGDYGKVGAWIYFWKQDDVYDGRLVKLFTQPGDLRHYSDVCTKCEGDEKNAPMLGLTIIKDMTRDGDKYEDGTILDPRDGSVYQAEMAISPDGQKLTVRGYIGIPLLGQTQVWRRLPDDAMADIPPPSHGPEASKQ